VRGKACRYAVPLPVTSMIKDNFSAVQQGCLHDQKVKQNIYFSNKDKYDVWPVGKVWG